MLDGPGAWAESKRNRKYLIAHLNAAIHGDTDVSLGMPEMMSPGMINARLGILYLFANTTWDEGVFRFVTSGVLDFAGKGDGKPAVRALKAGSHDVVCDLCDGKHGSQSASQTPSIQIIVSAVL